MATSNIMRIVRNVVGNDVLVWNDKLKGGERSIKIGWGHDEKQLKAVKAALKAAGYTVKEVQTNGSTGMNCWRQQYGALRLHVK